MKLTSIFSILLVISVIAGSSGRRKNSNKGVSCHCSRGKCSSSRCRGPSGTVCYSLLRGAANWEYGCSNQLDRHQRRVCEHGPKADSLSTVYDSENARHTILLCCTEHMCNRMKPEVAVEHETSTEPMNITKPETNAVSTPARPGWLSVALIIVPVCGGLVLVAVILLAARRLRLDTITNKQWVIQKENLLYNGTRNTSVPHRPLSTQVYPPFTRPNTGDQCNEVMSTNERTKPTGEVYKPVTETTVSSDSRARSVLCKPEYSRIQDPEKLTSSNKVEKELDFPKFSSRKEQSQFTTQHTTFLLPLAQPVKREPTALVKPRVVISSNNPHVVDNLVHRV